MKNILKEKKVRTDIIEASISSHTNDNFLELYKKTLIMNKFISKALGKNAVSTNKRASTWSSTYNQSRTFWPSPYKGIGSFLKAFKITKGINFSGNCQGP